MTDDEHGAVLVGRGLVALRDGVEVAQPVDVTLRAGQLAAVVGDNGAGKSSLLLALLGALPLAGRLTIAPGRIGYCPQRAALDAALPLTVADLLALERRAPVQFGARHDARVRAVLDDAGLPATHRTRALHALSGGEQQRLLCAAALWPRPIVALLDEPISSADTASRDRIHGLIARARGDGVALVVVTHDHAQRTHADVVVQLRARTQDAA